MANNGNLITAPVRVTDVKTVLGVSNNNVSYLCGSQHNKINMWSRYKPITYSSPTPDRNGNWWWLSTDSNRGIIIPDPMTPSEIASSYNNTALPNNGWSYRTPAKPFRLADFKGYAHNAVCPASYVSVSPSLIYQNSQITVNFGGYFNTRRNENELCLSDFSDIKDKFPGVIIYNGSRYYGYITLTKRVMDINTTQESLSFYSPSSDGTYKLYPIFCTLNQPYLSQQEPHESIPFPGIVAPSYRRNSAGNTKITAYADIYADLSKITYDVTLYAATNHTFNDVTLNIRLYNGSNIIADFYSRNLGNYTLRAGETKNISGIITSEEMWMPNMYAVYSQDNAYIEVRSGNYSSKQLIYKRPG